MLYDGDRRQIPGSHRRPNPAQGSQKWPEPVQGSQKRPEPVQGCERDESWHESHRGGRDGRGPAEVKTALVVVEVRAGAGRSGDKRRPRLLRESTSIVAELEPTLVAVATRAEASGGAGNGHQTQLQLRQMPEACRVVTSRRS